MNYLINSLTNQLVNCLIKEFLHVKEENENFRIVSAMKGRRKNTVK
jgi:hypothetical protein